MSKNEGIVLGALEGKMTCADISRKTNVPAKIVRATLGKLYWDGKIDKSFPTVTPMKYFKI